MKTLISIICCFGILVKCYSQKESKSMPSDFFKINIEEISKIKEATTLSQIANKVEYIILETNTNCLIRDGAEYFFTDKFIFVNNKDHVLKYTRDGKFITKIGNSGKGPEEIDFISTMSVLPKEKLVAIQKNSEPKLLFFNFDGKFIKAVNIPRCSNIKVLENLDYIAYESALVGDEKYNFLLINKNLDTLSVIRNQDTWENPKRRAMELVTFYIPPFFQIQNLTCFKSKYNDTVFQYKSSKILPMYFVDLGKYKLPSELKPEKMIVTKSNAFYERASEFYQWTQIEGSNRIFLNTANYKGKDLKYFIYDIPKRKGYLLNNNQNSSGIINDWDGGLDFWPIGNVDNATVFKTIDVLTLHKEKDNIARKKSKFPEKQTALIKLISGLDITNNPILYLVTLKK